MVSPCRTAISSGIQTKRLAVMGITRGPAPCARAPKFASKATRPPPASDNPEAVARDNMPRRCMSGLPGQLVLLDFPGHVRRGPALRLHLAEAQAAEGLVRVP